MKKSEWLDCQRKEFFPKQKRFPSPGQDRAQKHCDFRFSQIEKKSKVAVLQLTHDLLSLTYAIFENLYCSQNRLHDTTYTTVDLLPIDFLTTANACPGLEVRTRHRHCFELKFKRKKEDNSSNLISISLNVIQVK